MKNLIITVLAMTSSVFAIDLNQATNQQLLDELGRRLQGGISTPTAVANYICDSNYMRVTLTGATQSGNFSVYLGNNGQCVEQTAVLTTYKSKISSLAIVAICDSNYLKRYKFLPVGTITDLDSTYLGNYEQCLAQAKQINQN